MCYWCWQVESMDTLDHDLEMMYPKIYHEAYPMVVMHCDHLEDKYGPMFKLRNEELDDICEDMYNKLKDRLDDDDDKRYETNTYTRLPRYDGRSGINDILRILLLRELIGRRRRRRRRMRPYGYGGY